MIIFWFILLLTLFFVTFTSYKLIQVHKVWTEASLSNNKFIKKYCSQLKEVDLGCSFSPEMWNLEERNEGKVLEALWFIVEELKIKDIRLGIRWSEVLDQKGKLTLQAYKPYLDYCIKQKVDICLNVGPIKTFRWPEEHIPQQIIEKLGSPLKKFSKISYKHEISTYAIDYLDTLLRKIRKEYSQEQLEQIKIIQLENEGFNRMGTYKLKVGFKHLEKCILLANKNFPKAQILVNSSGRFNLRSITLLFKRMLRNRPFLKEKLIIGYDYYYHTEYRDKFVLTRLLDSIHLSLPWDIRVKTLKKFSKRHTTKTEVTEAQFEPWGSYQGPGNSVKDFKFMLLRSRETLSFETNDKNIIRLWGIEGFVKKILEGKLIKEHFDIIDLIMEIGNL